MDPTLHKRLTEAFAEFADVVGAWVHGSVAKNRARPESDLDVAVVGRGPLSSERLADIATKLGRVAGREVDIVDLAGAHGALLEGVLSEGTRLFVHDRGVYEGLMRRLVYEQADFMPLYRRLLRERRERFLDG